MKILALILARGGSKRLPGKNIRKLGGKPLIVWSIDAAKKISAISDILVSTDCSDIAAISRREGALLPWLRPSNLSTDTASSVDAALHALDWYESEFGPVKGVLLMQPTSPFRKSESISEAIALFETDTYSPVVSVRRASSPASCFFVEGENLAPILGWDELRQYSRDSKPAFTLNGSVYLTAPATLRNQHAFVTEKTRPFVMTEELESLDIDTEWDWMIAEAAVQRGLVPTD